MPGAINGSGPDPTAKPFIPERIQTLETAAYSNLNPRLSSNTLLSRTTAFVKTYMARYDASHDWQHILRVLRTARQIHSHEAISNPSLDEQTVMLAALLHDVGDRKYILPGESPSQVAELLESFGATAELAEKVQTIVQHVSYNHERADPETCSRMIERHPELAIVQDADRLDAIGATGVGRVFTYGGAKQTDRDLGGSIEHCYEKLLLLSGMMKVS